MEWVSTKEGLPQYSINAAGTKFVEVLVCTGSGMVTVAAYVNGNFKVFGVETTSVTHWQYMPDPPTLIDL